jgi:uncharacterized membrane protein YeaQ/YmgE (transglycosylase-associated protein family)
MHLSDEGLLVILVVGIIAGWLAGKVVRGNGFGLVGDAAIGIVGALVGDWLLHRFGVHFGAGIIGLTINATIGAIMVLLALRLLGASGWAVDRSLVACVYVAGRERSRILMCLVSRNAIRPSGPSSLPSPDSFQPPNGAWSSVLSLTLTPTAPHSNRSANDQALSRSRE